jgi:hypothetical protein
MTGQITMTYSDPTGKQLKQAALDGLEAARQDYVLEAREFAVQYAKQRGEISINEIRECCPPPADINPAVLGAILRGKQWEPVGYTTAKHPDAHARVIRTYRWKEVQ